MEYEQTNFTPNTVSCKKCGCRPRFRTVWFQTGDTEIPIGYYVICPICGIRTREVKCSKAKTPEDRKKSIDIAEKEWNELVNSIS